MENISELRKAVRRFANAPGLSKIGALLLHDHSVWDQVMNDLDDWDKLTHLVLCVKKVLSLSEFFPEIYGDLIGKIITDKFALQIKGVLKGTLGGTECKDILDSLRDVLLSLALYDKELQALIGTEDLDGSAEQKTLNKVERIFPVDYLDGSMKELKVNQKLGSFKTKEDYVSTHRELLRHDYSIPLKRCLEELKNEMRCSSDCANYDLASIESLDIPGRKLLLKLSVPKLKKQLNQYLNKKCLENGSLVFLISADNNQTAPIFGLICSPATEFIHDKVIVSVTLLKIEDLARINLNSKFMFFEYLKHFETYIHPILCLDKPLNKQFDEALVNCSNINAGVSNEEGAINESININSLLKEFNSSPMIAITQTQDLVNHLFEVDPKSQEICRKLTMAEFLTSSTKSENYKLSEIQLEGIKLVLNNKLSLIQGSPGTGKSFMGKTLVHFFLQNASLWSNSSIKSPIIIMGYTNRALDAFLEDVLPFTQKVIRLGSQFTSRKIETYSFNEILALARNARDPNFIQVEKAVKTQVWELKGKLESQIQLLNQSLNVRNFLDESFVHKNGIQLVSNMEIKWRNGEIREWLDDNPSEEINNDRPHWHNIPVSERKSLVSSAQTLFQSKIQDSLAIQTRLLSKLDQKIMEIQHLEGIEILKKADVIGVTVTGAIKFKKMLEFINSRIVLIEEAGQILESQVLAALPSSCTQLVMIGDHRQLKPSTTTYELAQKYNMNVSMFERLIINNIPFTELAEQCRMRPEISNLVSSIFYPNVRDHQRCHTLPNVKGVASNLLFYTHQERESLDYEDSTTKSNQYEAAFALSLASYLCNFHIPSKITVLTTYTGQLGVITELVKERFPKCQEVLLAVVDNYQGQENDIVILSLVRGGAESIGFLKESNRVCVALSRARLGLFIIGHVDSLTQKSQVWSQVVDHLQGENRLVNKFPLVCPNHGTSQIKVANVEEFDRAIKVHWCREICGMILRCSHTCPEVCHLEDIKHQSQFACRFPCSKQCSEGHPCSKTCSESCYPCQEKEQVRFEPCGHIDSVPCSSLRLPRLCQVETWLTLSCGHQNKGKCCDLERICDSPCGTELPCGHLCQRKCHLTMDPEDHTKQCMEPCNRLKRNCQANHPCDKACFKACDPCDAPVNVDLPCGHHQSDLICSINLVEFDCMSKCNRLLSCGHNCRQFCYECKEGCGPCPNVGLVQLTCGHSEKVPCAQLKSHKCSQPCAKLLSCGHPCPLNCGDPCSQAKCQTLVSGSASSNLTTEPCSHSPKIPCFLLNSSSKSDEDSPPSLACAEPCLEVLNCGHSCRWKCEDCFGGKLHLPCLDRCSRSLVCGHLCESTCGVPCPPCKKKCEIRCAHQGCKSKCGDPCLIICKAKCEFRCTHGQCKKKCSSFDGHLICGERCSIKMKCGHLCAGFCGEECPKECFECQSKEPRKISVLPCGHSITVDHVSSEGDLVKLPTCEICSSVIGFHHRFQPILTYWKKRISDVMDKIFQFSTSVSKFRKEAGEILKDIDDKEIQTNIDKRLKNPKISWTVIDLAVLATKLKVLREFPNSKADLRLKIAKKLMKFGACREEFFFRLQEHFGLPKDICDNVQLLSFEVGAWFIKNETEAIMVYYAVPK